jgi:hypothetical protein
VNGFLGYDPARLRNLLRTIDSISDEAEGIHFTDPMAADAAVQYRRALTLATAWRPVVGAVVSCAFDARYRPARVDAADPSLLDVIDPTDTAWATVTDPRTGRLTDSLASARHLAAYVATELTILVGRGGTADLAARLDAAMADATTRDAFLAALGVDGLVAAAEVLARPIAAGTGAGRAAQQLLASLARGLGAAYCDGGIVRSSWAGALANTMDPYAAALIVRDAGLDTDALVRLVPAIWQRWSMSRRDGIDDVVMPAAATPALLLETLTSDGDAGRRVLAAWPYDRLDQILAADLGDGILPAFLLASTDHGTAPAAEVEASMVAVLSYLDEHKDLAGRGALSPAMGAYAGPYLESVVGAHDGAAYPAPAWDWRGRDTVELVRWMASDAHAARDIEAWIDALVSMRTMQLAAAPGFVDPSLVHLGQIAGSVDRALADAAMRDAAARVQIWSALWGLLSSRAANAVNGALGVTGMAAYGVTMATATAIGVAADAWARNGWPGAPPDLGRLIDAERRVVANRNGDRQAVLVHIAFQAALAAGTLRPADEPPPYTGGDYLPALTAWAGTSPSPGRRRLWELASAISHGTCRETEACDGSTAARPGEPTIG